MTKKKASGMLSLFMVLIGFLLIVLGIYWLFSGLGANDGKLIVYGSASLIAGFIIAGISNFVNF